MAPDPLSDLIDLLDDFASFLHKLFSLVGLWFDPPKSLVGKNVTFKGCSEAQQGDIRNWLLDIYDNLTKGCLDSDRAVRNKMLDLITCLSLMITCDDPERCKVSPGNIPCGVTSPNELLAGQNRVHICFANCGGPGVTLEITVAHELSHIARYYVYGYDRAGEEAVAGKIGMDCG